MDDLVEAAMERVAMMTEHLSPDEYREFLEELLGHIEEQLENIDEAGI